VKTEIQRRKKIKWGKKKKEILWSLATEEIMIGNGVRGEKRCFFICKNEFDTSSCSISIQDDSKCSCGEASSRHKSQDSIWVFSGEERGSVAKILGSKNNE
jgi:hypothetical protein